MQFCQASWGFASGTNSLSICMALKWSWLYLLYQPYIGFIHPILLQFSKLGLDQRKCSLRLFFNLPKLGWALQVIQILILIALRTRQQGNITQYQRYPIHPPNIAPVGKTTKHDSKFSLWYSKLVWALQMI